MSKECWGISVGDSRSGCLSCRFRFDVSSWSTIGVGESVLLLSGGTCSSGQSISSEIEKCVGLLCFFDPIINRYTTAINPMIAPPSVKFF